MIRSNRPFRRFSPPDDRGGGVTFLRRPLRVLAVVLAVTLALLAGVVVMPSPALADHDPDPPTNLRVTGATTDGISFAWDAPSDTTDVNWYRTQIKRTSDSVNAWGSTEIVSPQSVLQNTYFNLNTGSYDIRVFACFNQNAHCSSAVQITAGTAPAKPTLLGRPSGDGRVSLQWGGIEDEQSYTGWRYEYKETSDADWSGATGVDVADAETTAAPVSGLGVSTSYDFRVRAVNAGTNGPWSDVKTVAGKPGSPQNFTAETVAGMVAVNLFWDFPSFTGGPGLTGYTIQWRPDATGNWVDHPATGSKTINPAATSATVSAGDGLALNTAYNFRISATNVARRSYWTPGDGSVEATTASTVAAISATNPATLKEGNLHGAKLTVDLAGVTYAQNLQTSHFSFSPSLLGLFVDSVRRVDDDTAELTLRFVWSDQAMTTDTDIAVVVGAAATSHSAALTSNAVTVGAFVTSTVLVITPGTAVSVAEGSLASIELSVSEPVPAEFVVTYHTADGTAVAPGDFPALSAAVNSLTVSPGQTSATIPVQTSQDPVDESNESFSVIVGVPSLPAALQGKVRLDASATSKQITITDDDERAGAPTGLSATASGAQISLTWGAPTDRGQLNGAAAAISGYQYRTATSSGDLSSAAWVDTGSAGTAHTIAVTTAGTHYFQVRARNGVIDAGGQPAGAASSTASAVVTIAAIVADTDPSPLGERSLDGARLTVDLVGTRYASSLSPGQFGLQPSVAGLSVASVRRVSDTQAVLTLAFDGNFGSDLDLSVSVAGAANAAGATLVTGGVMVSQAPTPGRVQNVRLIPGPGSLDVSWNAASNADGYVVRWKQSSAGNYDNERAVSGQSTTRTSLGELRGETGYDVQVYATSRFASDGPISLTASETTLPAHAIISATDPSPLTEANLGGATLTVDLLTERHPYRGFSQRWTAGEFAGWFTLGSEILGLSIASVVRVSDTRAEVTLAYDVTDPATDFDDDRTLSIRIGWEAIEENRDISAVTTVRAVVEPPPGRVRDVRLTPGPMRMGVTWGEVGDATGYRVEWSPPAYGWTSANKRRPWHTSHTIGLMEVDTEYTVRVVATKTRAPDGQPSGWVSDRTPRLAVKVVRTEPSPLRENNLHRARVTVDLEGIEWVSRVGGLHNHFQLGRVNDCSQAKYYDDCRPFIVNRSVRVAGVERVSGSRAIVSLWARGVDLGGEGLWLRFDHETHIASIHQLGEWLVVPVIPSQEGGVSPPGPIRNLEVAAAADRMRVTWDGMRGAEAYIVQWKSDAQGYDIARQARVSGTRHWIRGLVPATAYRVRVRAWTLNAPDGEWSEATATTQPFGAHLSRVDPSPLTEANLDGATLTIDLEGAQWARDLSYHTYRIGLHGVSGLRVERIELPEASRTRAVLHLAHSGADFDEDTTLTLRIGDDAHTWHGDITLTTPVTAIIEPETAQSRQLAPDEALPLDQLQEPAPDEALPL